MKNVKVKQKKSGNSSVFKAIIGVVVVVGICVGGTFFLTSRYYQNQAAAQPVEEEVDLGPVAVVTSEVAEGGYVEGSSALVSLPVTQIPENAITALSDTTGLVTKLHLMPNTILTTDMLIGVDMDEEVSDTARQIGINFIKLQSQVEAGDYIDIHIKTYSTDGVEGYKDQIVLSKKKVLAISGSTIYMNLDQEEQLTLNVASVQASAKVSDENKDNKTLLYGVALVSPAQPKAIEDYRNEELTRLIQSDPNLIRQAQEALAAAND